MSINWIGRSKETLTEQSENKKNFKLMLNEWFYNGESYDLEEPCEACELCGYREIRYQFTIQNKLNSNELLVGSECITRFDLSGIGENGEYIAPKQTQKRVQRDRQRLIKEARLKRVLNCLICLSFKAPQLEIGKTIEKFQDRGVFSPKHVLFIFWKLDQNRVSYNSKDFKVSLRRNREKDQIEEMKDWQLQKLKPCLTLAQKKIIGIE